VARVKIWSKIGGAQVQYSAVGARVQGRECTSVGGHASVPDQTFEMLLIGFDVKIRSKNLIRV
jgi:hypothetical protein